MKLNQRFILTNVFGGIIAAITIFAINHYVINRKKSLDE